MKDRVKNGFIFIFLLAVLLLVYRLPHGTLNGTGALMALLRSAGANLVEGEIQFYATLGARYREMDELEEILLDVADILGLQNSTVQRGEGDTFRVLEADGATALGPQAQIVVQSNPGNETLSPQTYLLIICRDESVQKLETVAARLDEAMPALAPGGQISYYLTGELPGQKTVEEMAKMADRALSTVRGTVVEGIKEDNLISYTAYTPLLERYLTVDGDRFNLNLAIRYDDYHKKTVVWVGYPVIHTSY